MNGHRQTGPACPVGAKNRHRAASNFAAINSVLSHRFGVAAGRLFKPLRSPISARPAPLPPRSAAVVLTRLHQLMLSSGEPADFIWISTGPSLSLVIDHS